MPPIPARHRHTNHSLRHLFSYPLHPLLSTNQITKSPQILPHLPCLRSVLQCSHQSSGGHCLPKAPFFCRIPMAERKTPITTLIPGPPDASRTWMKMRWATIHGRLHQQRSLRERAVTMHTLDTKL
jgi:hypothetical protein